MKVPGICYYRRQGAFQLWGKDKTTTMQMPFLSVIFGGRAKPRRQKSIFFCAL
jgi:hypothetical protein